MKPVQELDLEGLRILDGGMATELEQRGFDLSGPLWSAWVLECSPQTIAAVHRDYLEAGADCLLTASYQVSAEGYEELGRSAEDAAHALCSAVSVAETVRKEYQEDTRRKIWIAASLGPYGASLHNGSEFHGNYACSHDELVEFHRRRIAVVAETGADFIAFETIPSLEEAQAIAAALRRFPTVPASVTFTCRDEAHVAHGEKLRDCARLLDQEEQVIAIGVNCTPPKLIYGLIAELAQATTKPIAVYPNSGERWDPRQRRWQGERDAEKFGALARSWHDAGAQWIGGCCRTGPDHIRAVVKALRGGPPSDIAPSRAMRQ